MRDLRNENFMPWYQNSKLVNFWPIEPINWARKDKKKDWRTGIKTDKLKKKALPQLLKLML